MNKPITLCDRCDNAMHCLLNFDGVPCRKIRTVEPSKADYIRSMSNEELADFIAKALYGMLGGQPCLVGNGFEDCKNRWLNWLNQEVK